MMTLIRKASLTDQVRSHIKEWILSEELTDDRIPSETDLAAELGVSRTTVRDALSRLENEGLVYRKQGAGTFVNRAGLQIQSRLEEIWSYENVLRDHGYTPIVRILDVRLEPASAAEIKELEMEKGDKLLVVEKLFLAEEQPVIYTVNHIPEKLVEQPYTNDDFLTPVYRFLLEFCRQPLAYYLSEIVPVKTDAALSRLLKVPAQTALISFEEIGYNEDNQPILRTHSHFRDDLLRLRLIRRKVS